MPQTKLIIYDTININATSWHTLISCIFDHFSYALDMHRFATKLGDKHAICTETLRISSQAIYRASLPARSIGFHPIGNHYNLKTTDRTRERHKLYICYDTYTHVITQTYYQDLVIHKTDNIPQWYVVC